jgi:hypothetical protein
MKQNDLRIAIISDDITRENLAPQWPLIGITPLNYRWKLRWSKPDFLLVESAWQAQGGAWKYKIASYPDVPKRNNRALARVVAYARDLGIPTVFWNKEDGVHFERFIESAKLFDHVFTVDENSVPRYRAVLGPNVSVGSLMFAVQPKMHFATGEKVKYPRANFVGSYSRHIHEKRQQRQDMLFDAVAQSGIGLTVYDRNSGRKSGNYRYPELAGLEVLPAVPVAQTADIYRHYLLSLNVNTIEDSPTMFSRRLVEILACGGLAVTTPALSVDTHFAPYCHVVHTQEQAQELFVRLMRDGRTSKDEEMCRAAAQYVLANHSWQQRIEAISAVI